MAGKVHIAVLASSVYGMLCAGTMYMVGVYLTSVRDELQLSQSDTERAAYLMDLGNYFYVPVAGILQNRYGPVAPCSLSTVFLLTGYLGVYSILTWKLPVMLLMLFFFLVGMGSGQLYLSILSTCIAFFPPHSRGLLVGGLVSVYGISAFIYTQLYHVLLGASNVSMLMLLLASTCTLAALLNTIILPIATQGTWVKQKQHIVMSNEGDRWAQSGDLGGVELQQQQQQQQTSGSLQRSQQEDSDGERVALLPATRTDGGTRLRKSDGSRQGSQGSQTPQQQQQQQQQIESQTGQDDGQSRQFQQFQLKQQLTQVQIIQQDKQQHGTENLLGYYSSNSEGYNNNRGGTHGKLNKVVVQSQIIQEQGVVNNTIRRDKFGGSDHVIPLKKWYAVFSIFPYICGALTFMILGGSGLLFINNFDTLAEAMLGKDGQDHHGQVKTTLVSLFSIFNCVGRLSSSWVSDHLPLRRGWFVYISIFIFTTLGASLSPNLSSFGLHSAAVMGGVAYGIVWSILPVCISEMFGVQFFANVWSVTVATPAIGAVVLNGVAGWQLDSLAEQSTGGDQNSRCFGDACFRLVFLLVVVLNVIASVISVGFARATRAGLQSKGGDAQCVDQA